MTSIELSMAEIYNLGTTLSGHHPLFIPDVTEEQSAKIYQVRDRLTHLNLDAQNEYLNLPEEEIDEGWSVVLPLTDEEKDLVIKMIEKPLGQVMSGVSADTEQRSLRILNKLRN